jgi:acetylornithine deacetylase/succinyl-diaminopimelate desuccinylase-like protein
VRPLSARDKALIAERAKRLDEATFKKDSGVKKWVRDMPFVDALERLAGHPTVNIEGIVAGYGGPAGKTIVPHEALAKVDIRMVPDMTVPKMMKALRAHLDKRGFTDIEIRDLGSIDPTTTSFDSLLTKAQLATYRARGIEPIVTPRMGGTWPGYIFTDKPLSLATGHFGTGFGGGAHSKDEFYVIESKRPKVDGMIGATRSFAELMYQLA